MVALRAAMLVGSVRKDSINRRLARAFEKLAPDNLSFSWIRIDDLPFYNQDLEPGRTAEINRFTEEVAACNCVLMVMPEYNRSIPAVLKNAIDWGSKPMASNVWRGKPAAIAGTSPGQIGTAVGQQHLRQVLGILGATVMGGECYLKYPGDEAMAADGTVSDESVATFLKDYIARFADLAARLNR